MSTYDLSNHLAKTYRRNELRLIASLCTLSQGFFHYGFFKGCKEVMEPLYNLLEAVGWRIEIDTALYRNGCGGLMKSCGKTGASATRPSVSESDRRMGVAFINNLIVFYEG